MLLHHPIASSKYLTASEVSMPLIAKKPLIAAPLLVPVAINVCRVWKVGLLMAKPDWSIVGAFGQPLILRNLLLVHLYAEGQQEMPDSRLFARLEEGQGHDQ
jgi:hypothetical protein